MARTATGPTRLSSGNPTLNESFVETHLTARALRAR